MDPLDMLGVDNRHAPSVFDLPSFFKSHQADFIFFLKKTPIFPSRLALGEGAALPAP
jgi:hypothetical protein